MGQFLNANLQITAEFKLKWLKKNPAKKYDVINDANVSLLATEVVFMQPAGWKLLVKL